MAYADQPIFTFNKDPDATRDISLDWSTYLANLVTTGQTISASVWTVQSGITKVSDSNTTTTTTIRISGGTADETYILANKITTSGGEIDERSITVNVFDR